MAYAASIVQGKPKSTALQREIDLSSVNWTAYARPACIRTFFHVNDLQIKIRIHPNGAAKSASGYSAIYFRVCDPQQDDNRTLLVSLKCGSQKIALPMKKASYFFQRGTSHVYGLHKAFKTNLLKSADNIEITATLYEQGIRVSPTKSIDNSFVLRLEKLHKFSRDDGDVTLILNFHQDGDNSKEYYDLYVPASKKRKLNDNKDDNENYMIWTATAAAMIIRGN